MLSLQKDGKGVHLSIINGLACNQGIHLDKIFDYLSQ